MGGLDIGPLSDPFPMGNDTDWFPGSEKIQQQQRPQGPKSSAKSPRHQRKRSRPSPAGTSSSSNCTSSSSTASQGIISSGRRIYMGNLRYCIRPLQIYQFLKYHGFARGLEKIYMPQSAEKPELNLNRGYCFVTYETPAEAAFAMEKLHHRTYKGRRLVCRPSLPRGVTTARVPWYVASGGGDSSKGRTSSWGSSVVQMVNVNLYGGDGDRFVQQQGQQQQTFYPWFVNHGNAVYCYDYYKNGNSNGMMQMQQQFPFAGYDSVKDHNKPSVINNDAPDNNNSSSKAKYSKEGSVSADDLVKSMMKERGKSHMHYIPSLDYNELVNVKPDAIYSPPQDSFATRGCTIEVLNLPPLLTHRIANVEVRTLFYPHRVKRVSMALSQSAQTYYPTWCPSYVHRCDPFHCYVQFSSPQEAKNAGKDIHGKLVWHGGSCRRLYVVRYWTLPEKQ